MDVKYVYNKYKVKIIFYLIHVNVQVHVVLYIYNVYNIGFKLKLKNKLLGVLIISIIKNFNAKFVKLSYR
jgi:hypothetical protein